MRGHSGCSGSSECGEAEAEAEGAEGSGVFTARQQQSPGGH